MQRELGGAGRALCQNSIMNDYERVVTVIRYLNHHTEQPDLTDRLGNFRALAVAYRRTVPN